MLKEEALIPLVGAVVVAVIAGAISLSVAILTKDQKTSEFRQSWIDSLRNDVSKLAGIMYAMLSFADSVKAKGESHAYEFLVSSKDSFVDMVNLITRIRLRLNVKEHARLLAVLDTMSQGEGLSKKQTESLIEGVVAETQLVLKTEWQRVKRGEKSFQILKWSSAFVLLAGVIGVTWYFYPS
ncbi:hypothetical protein [Pseudomonas sp. AM4(2022)]|uniref:hypothetical protein n=1 Tax=Pseudomonas sp. AM4(2022) TaxID=2983408 RepID=UPI002E807216|nr:hypothetical protein [Pseudomonas sp. AM4(2022)]